MNAALVSLLLPLAGALLLILLRPARSGRWVIALSLGALVAAIMALQVVLDHGERNLLVGGWEAGLAIRFRLTPLAALLLVFTAGLHLLVALYAARIAHAAGNQDYWPLSCLLHAALAALWLSADLFNLYVTLELLSLVAVALVSLAGRKAWKPALNYLLRRGEHNRQRLQVGDASVVFWAEASDAQQASAAEDLFASLLSPPADDASEAARVRAVLDRIAKGRPVADLAPNLEPGTRMYVLGLAPNASRLSVRFWQVDTLGVLAGRIAQHAEDLRLEPLPWRTEPSVYRLVLATVPHREGAKPKADDAINIVIGETMRAILSGGPYPRSLLANTIMRFRADGDISGLRVALCKGVLARERRRDIRTSEEEIPVSLDKQSTQPGYLLGRLFAVLENVQRAALGGQVNATIRDRFYGAASATPASIFPVLLRNTQNHLGKLRKERMGQAVNLEKDIREIVGGLPDQFPRSLKIEDQGRFAIGYYHQSQSYFTRRDAAGAGDAPADESAEPTDIETEGADQ